MKNIIKTSSFTLLLATAVIGCSLTGNSRQEFVSNNIQVSAKNLGQRVADWQVGHIENNNFDYIDKRYHRGAKDSKNWVQGAFYIGLTEWAETVGDKRAIAHMNKVASAQHYQLKSRKVRHADHHAIAQMYLWLAEKTGNLSAYQPTQKVFDGILANPSTGSLKMVVKKGQKGNMGSCQKRWCWSDALFMAPRAWFQMTNVTGDDRYAAFADQEMWATVDYLFSNEYGLFYRDSTYFEQKSGNGKPIFWGRGNGWVFAGLPLMIDDLPQNFASRDKYIELYKKNAAGLVAIQNDNGFWSASLLDPEAVKNPEISGTAFITYGLAWGVNNGILTDAKYKQAVMKGWQAIEQSVEASGRVNWVQQVGKSPEPTEKSDTQLYGVGAVLLAAAEMTKWQG